MTVPEPQLKSLSILYLPTTSTAAAPSTLEASPFPSDLTLTALNADIPILHSTQPLYGGALPSTRAPLWTQGATSPPPLQEPFIPGAIHITFALHQQLQKIVREWRIRTSIFSHGRVYLSQLLARLCSHGPSPKVANLPSQLGTAASKGDAIELEDHHHFALTLEKGDLHCKSSTSFGSTSRTLKRSSKQSFSHLNL